MILKVLFFRYRCAENSLAVRFTFDTAEIERHDTIKT